MKSNTNRSLVNKAVTVGVVITGVCALCLLFPFLAFAFSNPCGNDEVREFLSPNGRVKAVVFRRNCGATTSHSTHVSVLRATGVIAQ